jgi:hypothetical protein
MSAGKKSKKKDFDKYEKTGGFLSINTYYEEKEFEEELEVFSLLLLLLLLTRGEGEENLLKLQWLSSFKTACHQQYKHVNDVNF